MDPSQVEQEILACQRQRFDAMVRGDLDALDRWLGDDLTYTHTSGTLDTKASLIEAIGSGRLRYDAIDPSALRVCTYGDVGVVTGDSAMRVTVRGEPTAFGIRFTDVYARSAGRWQTVAWQATRLPPATGSGPA